MNKLFGCAVAAGLAASVAGPAAARDLSPGAAAALGVLGGVAAGAAIAGAVNQAQDPYYPGKPVYAPPPPPPAYPPPPRPVYYAPPPPPEPMCHWEKTRTFDAWGNVTITRQQICE